MLFTFAAVAPLVSPGPGVPCVGLRLPLLGPGDVPDVLAVVQRPPVAQPHHAAQTGARHRSVHPLQHNTIHASSLLQYLQYVAYRFSKKQSRPAFLTDQKNLTTLKNKNKNKSQGFSYCHSLCTIMALL